MRLECPTLRRRRMRRTRYSDIWPQQEKPLPHGVVVSQRSATLPAVTTEHEPKHEARPRTTRPNKRMQLTKLRAAPVLQAEVPPCAPAGQTDGGTASQLIRGVRPTGAPDGREILGMGAPGG
jgi:hypothetical protein